MTDLDEFLEAPISEVPFCAVDVETSGLSMSSRVIEIGAVRFNLAGECYEYQALVNPCEKIWPAATDIHGITDDMVRSAPLASDVLPGLLNFMRGSVFLAHNATFDVRMIANELARARIERPGNPVLCTIRLARKRLAGPENYRLSTLVDFLAVDVGNLHNALPDAHAARHVFLAGVEGRHDDALGSLPGLIGSFDSVAPPSVEEFEPHGLLEELPALATSRLAIEMEYLTSLERGPVVVTPLYVFDAGGRQYLKAYCHRDGIPKTYRFDRIVAFKRI